MARFDTDRQGDGVRIGDGIKRARTRQGIDIRTVEERTKIRTRYLRAIEAEDWDALPSPAYAKGFLRTYAQLLGLDAEALVDEFRRQVERDLPSDSPLRPGEPVLERRRRLTDRHTGGPGPGAIAAGVVLAVAAAFLLIGLVGGDESGDDGGEREGRKGARAGAKGEDDSRQGGQGAAQGGSRESGRPVELELAVRDAVRVCLLGKGGRVLIASQDLSPGTEERFTSERFVLRLPSGYEPSQLELAVDGRMTRLAAVEGPAAFEIVAGSPPRSLDPPGEGCP